MIKINLKYLKYGKNIRISKIEQHNNSKLIYLGFHNDIFNSIYILAWLKHKENLEQEKCLIKNNRGLARKDQHDPM
jgi:hypothetical protein